MQKLNKRTKVFMNADMLRRILFIKGLKQVDFARETDLCTVIINRACTNRIISMKSAKKIVNTLGYNWDDALNKELVRVCFVRSDFVYQNYKFKWNKAAENNPINNSIVLVYHRDDLYHITIYKDTYFYDMENKIKYTKDDIVGWSYIPYCPNEWRLRN